MLGGRFLAAVLGLSAALGIGVPVSAQSAGADIVVIPYDSILRASEGSVTLVSSTDVPVEFQGSDCIAEVTARNQRSVHQNNDLVLESGATRGELVDIEAEAFGVVLGSVPLTLGSTIDVSLRMGPDEVSSLGFVIAVDCPQPAEPPPAEPPPAEPPPAEPPPAPPSVTPGGVGSEAVTPPVGVAGETASNAPAATRTLPATGLSSTSWAALVATILLVTGGGLVVAVRRPR